MSETPRFAMPLLDAAQAQKHVTVNEALMRADMLAAACVESRHLADPPAVDPHDRAHRYLARLTGAPGFVAGEGHGLEVVHARHGTDRAGQEENVPGRRTGRRDHRSDGAGAVRPDRG